MIEIEKPRIDCEQLAEDGSYGKFVVEPPASRSLVCSTSFLRFRALRKTLPKSC